MSDFFMFNETIGKRYEERDDLEGFRVEATDGKVGTVMDTSDQPGESYVIVDTGSWLLSRKVMLPAGVIDRIDYDAERIYVNRDKQSIKSAPEFDEGIYRHSEYRQDLSRHYSGT